jgi:hypothetical protein
MGHSRLGPALLVSMALLGRAGGVAAADGDADLWVRALRVDPLPLLTCDEGLSKAREATKGDLTQPWPARKDEVRPSILRVTVAQQVYCVKAFMVETSRPVPANTQDPTKPCGPQEPQRGMGGTRNLGKECKR